jgi:MSHA biogenesis protein MshJ
MKKLPGMLRLATMRFDAKTPRERLLMIVALAALLYFVIDALLLRPQQRQLRELSLQTEAAQANTQSINRQIGDLSAKLAQESAGARQAELDELKRLIAEADALLSEDDGSSLKLSALLETMLRTTPGLRLMSLKTLPVIPLLPKMNPTTADGSELKPSPPIMGSAKSLPEPPPVAVHQHGVEIVIRGNYLALLPYMNKLRHYPKRLFWTTASLEVVKPPDAILHLTITTLSEQKNTPLE